ncbi:MAG TPA: EamA family transporter [Terriglobales bacterium]|nr:EamA family transporter [Terriglobales bacterium]
MLSSTQIAPTFYALGAFATWGVSDFLGGYTARRFQPFFLAALGHVSGTALMAALAVANHEPVPSFSHMRWAFAAGICGGVALALFYRALSQGNMGIAAPVSAVLGAAIPVAFGIFTEGIPGYVPILGFVLALIGIWLISRPEGGRRPEGLLLATISGLGFAFFFIFAKKAGTGSALWIAALARAASLAATATVTLAGRKFSPTYRVGYALGLLAGCIDVTGTFFFVRAEQAGRLDTAVVLSSLYPALTVVLARIFLREHFTRWKTAGIIAALIAVPMIAAG